MLGGLSLAPSHAKPDSSPRAFAFSEGSGFAFAGASKDAQASGVPVKIL